MTRAKKNKKRRGQKQISASVPAHADIHARGNVPSKVGRTLEKAVGLYFQKKLKESIALLRTLNPSNFNNEIEKLNFHRLIAFAYANDGDYANAETEAMSGIEINKDDRDFYFVLSYVYSSYKDYDKCLENAEIFLKLYNKAFDKDGGAGYLSHKHLHLLYNFMGLAHKAKDNPEKAGEAFLKAIELSPSYDHPYLNLANFLIFRGEYEEADKIVEEGLKNCSQVQELRLMKKALENKATISACMIVKNEEILLPGCLESIRDWVDEIIIVDTGSTDRTVEIAKSYGAKIYFREWDGDFSAARNYSLSKATCDWIFIIDADEEFVQEDIPKLRQGLNQDNHRIVAIDVLNVNKDTGATTSFLPSNRFFRRDGNFYYDGIVHNQLRYERGEVILRADIRLKHYGYDLSKDIMKKKLARSKELLEKQLTQRPEDPFVHFNYAQILRSYNPGPEDELCDLILKHANKAVELSNTDPNGTLHTHLQALHQIVTTKIIQKKYDEAIDACQQALELKPDFLDGLYSLAEIYARKEEYGKAEEGFLKYLDAQAEFKPTEENVNMILLFAYARQKAYYWLGLIKQTGKKPDEAEDYFLKTLKEQEPFGDCYLGLANIYLDRRDMDKALEFIKREFDFRPESGLAHLYKARYYGLKKEYKDAEYYLDRAAELDDENEEILERTGVYWANKGGYEKAFPMFKKLTAVRPGYAHGMKLLSRAYYDSGDFKNSLLSYEKYLKLKPDDDQALNDMANCHFKLSDFENAEIAFARALEINDNLAAAYRNLGLTKIHLGKPKEALALLEIYNKIAPEDLDIELAIGGLFSQLSDYSGAIPHFEKYLTRNPNSIDGLFNISECYYNSGHIGSAVIGYKQILRLNPEFLPAKNRLSKIETTETPA
jgi:tetratricopeptide (TPR) repeat protein